MTQDLQVLNLRSLVLGPASRDSASGGVGWGPGMRVSNKHLGSFDSGDLRTRIEIPHPGGCCAREQHFRRKEGAYTGYLDTSEAWVKRALGKYEGVMTH